MATIAFLDGIDPITGSRRGVTFDVSQAGPIAKRKASPINHQTTDRMKIRALLKATNQYFWNLTPDQYTLWIQYAAAKGITGPYGTPGIQAACAAFFSVELNARIAGHPFYPWPPPVLPPMAYKFTSLTRIDNNTIRATFLGSPTTHNHNLYLRQSLPGPGFRKTCKSDIYTAEYSPVHIYSPYDFTPHFPHLLGWNCTYYTGTQYSDGRRTDEDLWTL